MKQRFYFDTSVFGGVYDVEFDEVSTLLFEKVKLGQVTCMYSDLTLVELGNAPTRVRDFFDSLPMEHLEEVVITDESLLLARTYIDEKVVGNKF